MLMDQCRPTHVALLLICALFGMLNAGCAANHPQQFNEFALGTVVSIRIYGARDNAVEDIVADQFAYLRALEQRMSTSEQSYSTSELLEVNRAAGTGAFTVTAESMDILSAAIELTSLTEGNFNVAIWPLSRLWDFELLEEEERLPQQSVIRSALERIDYSIVQLDEQNRTVLLPHSGMGLDVGGIAKGWAAEHIADNLRSHTIETAIIDIGGNIVTVGSKHDDSPWTIGIQKPDAPQGSLLGVIDIIGGQAIVTSGDYERYYEFNGERYHHIIDPNTGYPVRNMLRSVTVVARDPIVADALSTALFVMGIDAGYRFARDRDNVEALFVTRDRRIIATAGIQDMFTLLDEQYEMVSSF